MKLSWTVVFLSRRLWLFSSPSTQIRAVQSATHPPVIWWMSGCWLAASSPHSMRLDQPLLSARRNIPLNLNRVHVGILLLLSTVLVLLSHCQLSAYQSVPLSACHAVPLSSCPTVCLSHRLAVSLFHRRPTLPSVCFAVFHIFIMSLISCLLCWHNVDTVK